MSGPRVTPTAIARFDPVGVAVTLLIQYPRVPSDSLSKSVARYAFVM